MARINDRHVLLIEDKTYTGKKSGNQLNDYRQAVIDGKTPFKITSEEDLFAIFLKTGNQSLASRLEIERGYPYRVFDRDDFLKVLESYEGDNAIVLDFRQHLTAMNEECQQFHSWEEHKTDNWTREAWQGLFMELEKQLFDVEWLGWDYVPNRGGGFLGLYWWLKGIPEDCSAYLQLEYDKLCFKLDLNDLPNEKRWEWCDRITSQSELAVKPSKMGSGNVVTVAVYEGGWIRFDDRGVLDLKKTVEVLRSAEKILRQAANN